MTTPYLIAHKVRGQPAFDVAIRMECPICMPVKASGDHLPVPEEGCNGCDGQGFWWIIPTSGHRAYPYWSIDLDLLGEEYNHAIRPGEMPADHPDHYASPNLPLREPDAHRAEGRSLLTKLGLGRAKPFTDRRI